MIKKRGFFSQLIRHMVQLAAFILFPGLFIMVLSAVRDLVTACAENRFSLVGLFPQMLLVITVFLVTALWGRFFCGFLCSFGMMQELLFILSGKTPLKKVRIPERFDKVMKYLKYGVLVFITAAVWILALPVDSSWDPWGVFGMLIFGNPSVISGAIPTVGFVLLLTIAVGSLFVERFFCRYLCPLGALFVVISGKRLYKVRRRSDTCTNCGLCTRTCSMGIHIPEKDAVVSGECIQCMQCLSICPKDSLSANPAGAIVGTAAAAAIGGTFVAGNLVSFPVSETVSDRQVMEKKEIEEKTEITEKTEIEEKTEIIEKTEKVEKGKYKDGVYTGIGEGFRGTTQVQVTVKDGAISDIAVLSFQDDREFFQKAQSAVINDILAEQTYDVDAVSGATFSSHGIMDAVADALESGLEEPEPPADNSKEDIIDSEIDSETERSFETGEQEAGGEEDSGEGEPGTGRENGSGAGRHGNGRHGRGRHDGSGGGGHRGRQN